MESYSLRESSAGAAAASFISPPESEQTFSDEKTMGTLNGGKMAARYPITPWFLNDPVYVVLACRFAVISCGDIECATRLDKKEINDGLETIPT